MLPLSTNLQKKRFVSLTLPHFAIENQKLLRAKHKPPENNRPLKQQAAPFALTNSTTRGLRLNAINKRAEQQGLTPGMALSDALALCPLLKTSRATPRHDARKLLQLARWCERYSPLSNVYDKNSLWIDVTGTSHLYDGERNLLTKINDDFHNLGYTVNLALAGSFGAAFALSHIDCEEGQNAHLILPGNLRSSLSPLPVKALRLSPTIISSLYRLGLVTIGQLLELPRPTLKRRFPSSKEARSVLLRLDQLLGLRDEPLSPLSPATVFTYRLRYEEMLYSQQMLERALVELISKIVNQLESQQQGARQITFTLWRIDASTAHIKIGTNRPCRDKSHILNLFKEKLKLIEPGFGIDTIALRVEKSEPLPARQTSLAKGTQSNDFMNISDLIDRLHNHLGEQKTGYLHTFQSRIPERAQRVLTTPPPENTWLPIANPENGHPAAFPHERPFLLLNPPEHIEVMAPLPDNPPLLFTWRRVTRKIIASNGPERIIPEWWREMGKKNSRPRDYYRVITKEGGSFWLYRDGLYEGKEQSTSPPQWYMHGFFG
jgi:protein ImuB